MTAMNKKMRIGWGLIATMIVFCVGTTAASANSRLRTVPLANCSDSRNPDATTTVIQRINLGLVLQNGKPHAVVAQGVEAMPSPGGGTFHADFSLNGLIDFYSQEGGNLLFSTIDSNTERAGRLEYRLGVMPTLKVIAVRVDTQFKAVEIRVVSRDRAGASFARGCTITPAALSLL